MSYAHILNLYKPEAQKILAFKKCYVLEKIHGTSAHIAWNEDFISFFPGGEKRANFMAWFDGREFGPGFSDLARKFRELVGESSATVYGEAYGGKCQGMSATYGKTLRFIAFDVKVGDSWLAVPQAAAFCKSLGLEFVSYKLVPATVAVLDIWRDAKSMQAIHNGMGCNHPREGIVVRPPFEVRTNNGERVCAKHKNDAFKETKTHREVDPAQLKVLTDAEAVAGEWVTPMRLEHVLDRLEAGAVEEIDGRIGANLASGTAKVRWEMKNTGAVIHAMVEDVLREAGDEIVESKPVRKAIGQRAAALFKKRVQEMA